MSKNKSSAMSNTIIIVTAVAIGWALFLFVLGNGANFEEGDNSKHPLNIMGIMFKGGIIVPFLIAVNLIVIAFTIERLITLGKVGGKGSVHGFIQNIRNLISNNQITEAIERLKTNPEDRGIIVSAWNVGELKKMALRPCHTLFQFYAEELTHLERSDIYDEMVKKRGGIDTDDLNTDEKLDRRLVHLPIGRFGHPKEIAQAVAFLASNESSLVNASDFIVDGGLTSAYLTPL